MDTFSKLERLREITHVGQEFSSEPVYVSIKPEVYPPIAAAVSGCFPDKIIGAYELVKLNWKSPDGTPKFAK